MNTEKKYRSLNRILDILELLAANPDGMPLKDIINKLGSPPKSSVYTVLHELIDRGYISYDEKNKYYKIGSSLIQLSSVILSKYTIQKHARTYMKQLVEQTGEDVYLGVLVDDKVFYVDKVEGNHSIKLNISIGSTRTINGSCTAKLLMSYLPKHEQERIIRGVGLKKVAKNTIVDEEKFYEELGQIRKNEYAFSNEESIDGIGGIAVPIKNRNNNVIAAICISAPKNRILDNRDFLLEKAVETAYEISKQL